MQFITDCFGYNKIYLPQERIRVENVITSTISPGYEHLLDDLLYSLHVVEGDTKYSKIIFLINPDRSCYDVVRKWNCGYIVCESIKDVTINSKSVLYSLDEIIDFKKMLYLDSDTLILNSIEECFYALDAIPDDNLMVCRDFYFYYAKDLNSVMQHYLYQSHPKDFSYLLYGQVGSVPSYPFIVNAGVIVCKPEALKKSRDTMLSFYDINQWINYGRIREQLAFNIGLAKDNNLTILHNRYNFQMVVGTLFEVLYDNVNNSIRTFNYFEPFSEGWVTKPDSVIQKNPDFHHITAVHSLDRALKGLNGKFDMPQDYKDVNVLMVNKNRHIREEIEKELVDELLPLSPRLREEDNIHIVHFCGPRKDHFGLRKVCMEALHKKEANTNPVFVVDDPNDLRFCINTHKDYQAKTLPLLLESMIVVNRIPKGRIIICSSAWDSDSDDMYDGIRIYKRNFNAYEHAALITIAERDFEGEYWFNLHDTVKCGPRFYNILRSKRNIYTQYEYSTINTKNILNMGIFRKDFLMRIKNYLVSLKNCSKQRSIMSEHMYPQMSKCYRMCRNYEVSLGCEQVYPDGVTREVRYFEELDLYKYQANSNILSSINKA